MKLLISPAKSLDFESVLPTKIHTQPQFLEQSKVVHQVLKQKSTSELSNLMAISEALSKLNWERNQNWTTPFTPNNARPAVFTFSGDVYIGLDAYSIPSNKFELMQDSVRILSGLYGMLKPLDLIQPYRLEMGTKMAINESKNLYDFWKKSLTNAINSETESDELIVNLASKEYASVIDFKAVKATVITPEFKDFKNGNLKIISFFAKKARGMMVRYVLDNNIKTIDGLKGFNYDGYCYDDNLSKGNNLIFTR